MFDILDSATSIDRHLMIEASAGTGKTFSIQHLFVRNLLRGVKLSEILVVTFTKASTKELKERILATLREIQEGKLPPYFPDEAWAKKRVEEALREFDACEIDTIHAFAKRMLSTYAFEANLFVEQLHDEAPMDQEKIAAVRDFLRTDLEGLSYSLAQKKVLLSLEPEKIAEEEKVTTPFLNFKELFAQFIQLAPKFPQPLPLVDAAPSFIKEAEIEEIEDFQQRFEVARSEASLEAFDQLLFAKMSVLDHFAVLKKKGVAPPWLPLFQEELTPLLKYALSKEILKKRFIFDLAPLIREKTLSSGKLGFDEILVGMEQAVHSKWFANQVRSRYKTVLIDEFQDTDPIQWHLFSTLFLNEWGGVLYLVGDPKQSIYAFRNADIYTYLKACESLGSGAKVTLDTNFRSHPKLVEDLNAFFATERFIPLPKIGGYLPYHPVRAGRKEAFGEEERSRIDFFEGESLEEVLADMTALIQQKKCEKCCVLIKDKNQGKKVSDFFREHRVPHFFLKRADWEENQIVYHLKLFLKALHHPEDLHRLKALLASKLGGYTALELEGASYPELIALLKKIGELGFFAAFEAFKNSPFCKLRLEEGELEQIYKVIDMAEKKGDIELFLDRLYLGVEKEEEGLFNPKEMEGEGVALCTLHMSKGLEFDHVFAIGLAAPQRRPEAIEVHPEGYSIKEVMQNRHAKGKTEEVEAEWMRQLYVAMTRAKETLYVPSYPIKGPSILSYYLEKHPVSFRKEPHRPDRDFTLPKRAKGVQVEGETDFKKQIHLIHSYTSLAKEEEWPLLGELEEGQIPRSKEVGITLHALLERVPYGQLKSREAMVEWVKGELAGDRLAPWSDSIGDLFFQLFDRLLPFGFRLREVSMLREIDFLFTSTENEFVGGGMEEYLTGKIDALFSFEGKYYLIDWKSNWLSSYGDEALREYMERSSYPLQARIYQKALAYSVEKIEKRPFDESFGGCLYIFLRGIPKGEGVILWKS